MARPVVVLLGVLGLALNLRVGPAAYPPLLETARADLGSSAGVAGLVQAGVVLAMAVGSLTGARWGERFGRERALGGAVAVVAGGSAVRVVPHVGALLAGSIVIGLGIGVAGVLLAGVVQDHLGHRAGAVSGGYVVAMLVGATAASALAVPLAEVAGGWSLSLAVWAVPAAVAVAAWVPVARRAPRPAARPMDERPGAPPWRDGFARLAACYLSGVSLFAYGWMTWLAPYLESLGRSPAEAGVLLGAFSLAQIPTALAVPALADRYGSWVAWSGATVAVTVAGTLGMLLTPELMGAWPWVLLLGVGGGAGFPLILSLIARRTSDPAEGAAVSGLALGVGYTVAGVGPVLMGALLDLTGAYVAPLAVLLGAAALQGLATAGIALRGGAATPPPGRGASAARTAGTSPGR